MQSALLVGKLSNLLCLVGLVPMHKERNLYSLAIVLPHISTPLNSK